MTTPPIGDFENAQPENRSSLWAVATAFGRLTKGYARHTFNQASEACTIAYLNSRIDKRANRLLDELAGLAIHNGNQGGLTIPAYMKSKFVKDAADPTTHGNLPYGDIYDLGLRRAAPFFAREGRLGEYAIGLGEFIYELRTKDLNHAPEMLICCADAMCDMADTFVNRKNAPAIANNYLHWIGVLHDDQRCSGPERDVIRRALPTLREQAIEGGHLGEFQITLSPTFDRYFPAAKAHDTGLNHNK